MSVQEVERQTCDSCGSQVYNMSLDVMVSVTMYDNAGDILRTMEPISRIGNNIIEPDNQYLVICSLCAQEKFQDIYNRFITELQGEL